MNVKFEKYLYTGFRDMSFLQKFKVALNPMYRILKEVVKILFLPIKQQYIKNKNFTT